MMMEKAPKCLNNLYYVNTNCINKVNQNILRNVCIAHTHMHDLSVCLFVNLYIFLYHPGCRVLTTIYPHITLGCDLEVCPNKVTASGSQFCPERFCKWTNSVPSTALLPFSFYVLQWQSAKCCLVCFNVNPVVR